MSTFIEKMSGFNIISHTIPSSHLREYPGGTISAYVDPPLLRLAVKQYVPRSLADRAASPGDITIILCHANGFHKELYEPFLEELLVLLEASGVGIRSIWTVDAAHQGASGVLNEKVLGDDPCWNDYPRDVLHMVDFFREQMLPPIFGFGHSFGGHSIARASLMHPSLFSALVLIDPVIEEHERMDTATSPAKASARRMDKWPDLASAEKYFRSREFYKRWDPRVLDRQIEYGLRPLPTAIYPHQTGLTLTTTKHQEVFTFLRNNTINPHNPSLGRPEPGVTFRSLHLLVPSVIFITGSKSEVSPPEVNERKREVLPESEHVEIDAGHLIPQEHPKKTAEVAAPFIIRQLQGWKKQAQIDQNTARAGKIPDNFFLRYSKI